MAEQLGRYVRQMVFPGMGEEGQRKLLASAVALIGCGGLGSHIANNLVRAGIGRLKIADRDYIELSNLQRQILYDEQDVAQGLPKVTAAAQKLQGINSLVQIEPLVVDVNSATVEDIIGDVHLVLDGSDNLETRYVINDACVKHGIPWIYGGAVASYGMTMNIIPHQTPCLRCLYPHLPPPGTVPTCVTAGILASIVAIIASLQCSEALKLLTGQGRLNEGLIHIDVWENSFEVFSVERQEDCPACGKGRYEFLEAK
jgi:molybdopterin/thiamine biosynthesis adenylyltransferase